MIAGTRVKYDMATKTVRHANIIASDDGIGIGCIGVGGADLGLNVGDVMHVGADHDAETVVVEAGEFHGGSSRIALCGVRVAPILAEDHGRDEGVERKGGPDNPHVWANGAGLFAQKRDASAGEAALPVRPGGFTPIRANTADRASNHSCCVPGQAIRPKGRRALSRGLVQRYS